MSARTSSLGTRRETQVGTAEGNDPRVRAGAGEQRHAIRPGAGAEDRVGRLGDAARMLEAHPARTAGDSRHLASAGDLAAPFAHVRRVGGGDRGEVHEAGARRVQSGDPAAVRLERADAIGVEAPQPGDAVRAAAALELVEAAKLCGLGGDDHLAARLTCDRPLFAIGVELARPRHAQARLQGPRQVVDAGVHHARVVARLMCADVRFALEHAHASRAGVDG